IVSVGQWLVLRELAAGLPVSRVGEAWEAQTLALRDGERRQLIPVADIAHIEADDNHVRVFTTGGEVHRVRERLGDIEALLDSTRFVRIHRSAIVPIGRVRAVVQLSHGDWAVDLASGVRLRVARGRRHLLQQAIAARINTPTA
ncbi:MAG TPA: LytTR family DNA-binding domain-containing protein, partial [Gemmatimonadales bacterium]|nr:LytTR family DNA-binding domain-containing protein [Gemmatimonadales bacterium]